MENKIQVPSFVSKADRFKWLGENKALLLEQKKATTKEADTVPFFAKPKQAHKADADKALLGGGEDEPMDAEEPTIKASLVINTTNVIDSHLDVHIKGIWKKCLNEKKNFYLLQEHSMTFKNIITDRVKAYTKSFAWSKLGAPYEGSTEALMFDVEIDEDRNEYMYEQYSKGFVKQHSVGMRYVKIFMCINDDSKYWVEEKANWDKYYPEVVNKEIADEFGYFWAVTEAKIIEGSAVVLGSNPWTPAMTEAKKDIDEPSDDDQDTPKVEPLTSTQKVETPIVEQTKSTFLNPNMY